MGKEIKLQENDWIVCDPETGEIKERFGEGDKIIHAKEDDGFIYNFNKGESFVKIFDNTIKLLCSKLTGGEFTFVMSVIPYVSYDDNILRLKDERLTLQGLANELGLKYDTTRKTVKSLQNKGVFAVAEVGCIENPNIKLKSIIANPYIYIRGTKEKREIAGLFEGTGWNKVLE